MLLSLALLDSKAALVPVVELASARALSVLRPSISTLRIAIECLRKTSRPALLGGLVFGSSLSVRDLIRLGSSALVLGGGFIIESSASVFGDGFIIKGDSSTSAVYLVGSALSL